MATQLSFDDLIKLIISINNKSKNYISYINQIPKETGNLGKYVKFLPFLFASSGANFAKAEKLGMYYRQKYQELFEATGQRSYQDKRTGFSCIETLLQEYGEDFKIKTGVIDINGVQVVLEKPTQQELDDLTAELAKTNCANILNKKELMDKFVQRLRTQDRRKYKSANIRFSTRLMSKIFENAKASKDFRNWMEHDLKEMKLITDKGELKFNSIKAIELKNGTAIVYYGKNKTALLMTEVIKKNQPANAAKTYAILNTSKKGWGDISIDHEIALANVLNNNIKQLPGLVKLSKKIDKVEQKVFGDEETAKQAYVASACQWTTKVFKEAPADFVALKDDILADLCKLNLSYVLMEKSYNSRKNDD